MKFVPAGVNSGLEERISAFPFFAGLSGKGKSEMLQSLKAMRLEKGLELLEEGALCQALLLVENGSIRVFKKSPAGREITLYHVGAGESCVLGTSCVVNDLRYPAHAFCANAADVLALPANVFRQLYEEEAPIRSFVMDLFSRRLANLMMLVEEVAFRRMDERLAAFLVDRGKVSKGVLKPVAMSHEEIASHLGTAREVVSRVLQQFADEQLVRLERKKVILLEPEGLSLRSGGR